MLDVGLTQRLVNHTAEIISRNSYDTTDGWGRRLIHATCVEEAVIWLNKNEWVTVKKLESGEIVFLLQDEVSQKEGEDPEAVFSWLPVEMR